jgi:hypothetical protein
MASMDSFYSSHWKNHHGRQKVKMEAWVDMILHWLDLHRVFCCVTIVLSYLCVVVHESF